MSTSTKDLLPASDGARGDGSRPVSGGTIPFIRIPVNVPAPDEWTLVREVNMEKREPCEVIMQSAIQHLLIIIYTSYVHRYGDLESCTNYSI